MYDPLLRGQYPVGVRTESIRSTRDERGALTIEIWYPAIQAWQGCDRDDEKCDRYVVAPEFGPRLQHAVREVEPDTTQSPLVVFSHHSFGNRRESTHLTTHLASHGYVVAAVDHSGNTLLDHLRGALRDANTDTVSYVRQTTQRRTEDVLEVISHCSNRQTTAVGALGHSWGGYTALDVTSRDSRVQCVCGMAPGGAATHLATDCLREWLDLDWNRPVPALIFTSDLDSQIPCEGVVELYKRLNSPKRLCILDACDHAHYVDRVALEHQAIFRVLQSMANKSPDVVRTLELMKPIDSLRNPDDAKAAVRAVVLAHFDAELRSNEQAGAWLTHKAPAMESIKHIAQERLAADVS